MSPISTAILDKRIAKLQKKLDGMDAIKAEIAKLESARERVSELEAMFPTRKRGPRAKKGKKK